MADRLFPGIKALPRAGIPWQRSSPPPRAKHGRAEQRVSRKLRLGYGNSASRIRAGISRLSNTLLILRYDDGMATAFQGSLLDMADEASPAPLGPGVRRTFLAHGAWVDIRPGWITGADALFERLATAVPWRAERRTMYDQVVDVPRLLCFYGEGTALPDPVLAAARDALSEHYRAELGEPLC